MFSKWGFASGMAIVLFGLMVNVSEAQQKGRGGGGFGFNRGSLFSLINQESVQKDIGVADDAKAKLTSIAEKYRDEIGEQVRGLYPNGFQDATREERQKATEKTVEITRTLTAKYAPQLKEALKPEQFTRLQQISWQASGAQALTEADLAKELNISKEQQDKIANVLRDYQAKQRELFTGGNFQENAGKLRELGQQRDKMAEEVLNKEQQDKLAKLKGKTFDMSQLQFNFGGGRKKQNNN